MKNKLKVIQVNVKIIEQILPEAIERMKNNKCPICNSEIKPSDFKDRLSVKEFGISGMCQKCQDKTFG